MKNKKLLLGLFFGIFLIIINSYGVMANVPVTLNSPVAGTNYSGTMIFNCSIYNVTNTGLMGNYNISLYFNNSVNTSGLGHSQFTKGAFANASTNSAERVITLYNTSVNQTEFVATVSINSSFFTPNAFTNFTCYAFNGTDGNYSVSAYPVRIDSVNPNVTINLPLNNYLNYTNYTNTKVYLNVTISDNLGGGTNITSVYFNITKSDGSQWNISTAANGTAKSAATVWYYSTINAIDFPDGTYNVTAYVTDRAGSINSSQIKYSIIFDNSGPGISAFSCSPTSVNVGRATACTCTATDLVPFTYTYTAAPAVSSVGTHTLTCTTSDDFGQETSLTTTYTVTSGGSTGDASGGGGGTTTTWTNTLAVTNTQLEAGYTQELKAQERMKVSVAGGTHHVGVKSVTATSATIEISSDPVSVTLDIGEDAKVDVDNDGTYDLYVKLNGIANTKADVTVKKLSEAVPEGAGPVSTSGEIETTTGTGGGGETTTGGGSKTWVYIVVVIIILVIVGVAMAKKKK